MLFLKGNQVAKGWGWYLEKIKFGKLNLWNPFFNKTLSDSDRCKIFSKE